jgi:hypothetical protein
MNYLKSRLVTVCVFAGVLAAASCNNNRAGTDDVATEGKDTNLVDTRRNAGGVDTTNYLTKDSGNQSQDVVDPNPPQNSRD